MKNIIVITAFLSMLVFGCKKKDDTTPEPETTTTTTGSTTGTNPVTIGISSTPQVQFTLNGTSYSYIESMTAPAVGNGQSIMGTTATATVGTDYFNSAGEIIKIEKGTYAYNSGSSVSYDDQFDNFFAKTSFPYSVNSANGITITWYDASGNPWSTDNGSQTGSSFTIIDKVKDYLRNGNGFLEMKVYASFNCKVYNTSGASKTITNGKFVGYYSNN